MKLIKLQVANGCNAKCILYKQHNIQSHWYNELSIMLFFGCVGLAVGGVEVQIDSLGLGPDFSNSDYAYGMHFSATCKTGNTVHVHSYCCNKGRG